MLLAVRMGFWIFSRSWEYCMEFNLMAVKLRTLSCVFYGHKINSMSLLNDGKFLLMLVTLIVRNCLERPSIEK